jgi:hypothetical protein
MLDPKVAGCKGKLFGMVAFIFFSGMVVGAFTMNLAERYWLKPKPAIMEASEKQVALDHLCRELQLDDSQARAVEDILDEIIMQHADLMAQFQTNRSHVHDRIMSILNEEQKRRFDQVMSEISTQEY